MIQFTVEGMSCNHCISAITRAVRDVDPVASVDVTLASQSVKIDSAADVVELREAIEDAGYAVKAVETA
jgi:copper chaperone